MKTGFEIYQIVNNDETDTDLENHPYNQKWYSEEEYNELKIKLAKAEECIKTWINLEHQRDVEIEDINLFDNEEYETEEHVEQLEKEQSKEEQISWDEIMKEMGEEPDPCDGGCGRIWSDEDPYDIFVFPDQPDKRYCEECHDRIKNLK